MARMGLVNRLGQHRLHLGLHLRDVGLDVVALHEVDLEHPHKGRRHQHQLAQMEIVICNQHTWHGAALLLPV